MTITHHPTDHTIAAFAAGTLDEGRALVVATHLSLCPACRKADARLRRDRRRLARSHRACRHARRTRWSARWRKSADVAPAYREARPSRPRPGSALPSPLAEHEVGPWRWIGRGVHWRSVDDAGRQRHPGLHAEGRARNPAAAPSAQGHRMDLRDRGRLSSRSRPLRPGRFRRGRRHGRAQPDRGGGRCPASAWSPCRAASNSRAGSGACCSLSSGFDGSDGLARLAQCVGPPLSHVAAESGSG